jgi:hypothetical protein
MNEVFEIDNLKTAVSIIKKFEGNKFITFEKDEESVEAYAKKQLEAGHMLVGYLGDEPAGYVCFYSNDQVTRVCFVSSIVIGEYGLANGRIFLELVKKAIDIGVKDGMKSIKVQVDGGNKHARRLYEKLGFMYTGEEDENGLYMVIDVSDFQRAINIKNRA